MSTEQERKYMRGLTYFLTFSGSENVTKRVKSLMYFLSCSVLIVYDSLKYRQSSWRVPLWVINEVRTRRFRNFRPRLPSCTCIYAFSLHSLPPSTSVRILFLREYVTDIFYELLSMKKPQTTLQNKETTAQSYQKMSNQNTKKSHGIKGALLNR